MEHWFPGKTVQPKQAGTNSLIDHVSCGVFYSNKAQAADDAVLDVFELDADRIRRAREYEDLIQFVMRGAIRRPEFDGDYDVFVYDLEQARVVEDYLRRRGVTDDVTLIPEQEVGILDMTRLSRQRSEVQVPPVSAEEQQRIKSDKVNARQARSRAKKKEVKIANGTYRGPGAPRKDRD
jgi:hypothetical protein